MKKIAVLTATAMLAVGGSSVAYAVAASTSDAAPATPTRAVLGAETSGITSPSFVRTSAGVKPVKPAHRHAEPGDDHGRHAEARDDRGRHAEAGDDRGRHAEPGDDRGRRHAEAGDDRGRHGGHGADD